MKSIIISILLGTLSLFSFSQEPSYPDTDLGILVSIRDLGPTNSPLKSEWADTTQADSWPGVTWDTDRHGRVIKLDVYGKQLSSLEVRSLGRLQELDCSYNELVSLDLSGLANLQVLDCSNNTDLVSLDLSGLVSLQGFGFWLYISKQFGFVQFG